jgi:ParB family chromosome partitioning protein
MKNEQDDETQRALPLAAIEVEQCFNPRGELERKALERLVRSIREHGVLVPLVVADEGDRRCRLVAGHRRHRAAGEAGLDEVPVMVRDPDERTRGLELALVENMAREASTRSRRPGRSGAGSTRG